ncbi:hypothetical protein SAMN02745729_101266 [Marinobacterium iners DSM 11526]|uniref:Uncharacterized protein n=1 Tax=Marinobacterium iners DSM 11526 TaxID=1122198 RepID=A0A1H3XWC7_9GAMM|nr:hypothetical protein SAMN02745729_101266 [Marinobacterium iners DSM 11526]
MSHQSGFLYVYSYLMGMKMVSQLYWKVIDQFYNVQNIRDCQGKSETRIKNNTKEIA